jgi:F0F1-type ATP synthase assembly protein I
MPTQGQQNKKELQKANQSSGRDLAGVYRYSGMAIKMAAVIAAGVFGGQYLDEKLELETPWFTLLFSIVGVAMAIVVVIRDTKPR